MIRGVLDWARSLGSALVPALLLALTVASAFVALDEILAPTPPISRSREVADELSADQRAAINPEGNGRVFMFFIDSTRHDVATNPAIMPNLLALAETGSRAKVQTCNDAVTVPSLRAAFTGNDNFRVFGFVGNLIRGESTLRSWFTQMAEAGKKVAVFSDSAFRQFNADIDFYGGNRVPEGVAWGDGPRQTTALRNAVAHYQTQAHDAVIFHMTYGDHVSHRRQVGDPEYIAAYQHIDRLVAEVAAAISPKDTLLVFSDHGHNDRGTHSMGMDIPTFAIARGPGFVPGADIGLIPITHLRHWFSWAARVPLEGTFDGEVMAPSLAANRPLAETFVRSPDAPIFDSGPNRSAAWLLVCVLGAMAAAWSSFYRAYNLEQVRWLGWCPSGSALATGELIAWMCGLSGALIASAFVAGGLQMAVLTSVAFVARVAWASHRQSSKGSFRRHLSWWLLPIAAGCIALLWGEFLAELREWIHCPSRGRLWNFVVAVFIVSGVASLYIPSHRVLWALLALVGLAAHPSIYRYGTVGCLQYVVFAGLIIAFVRHLLQRADYEPRWSGKWTDPWRALASLPWRDRKFQLEVARVFALGFVAVFFVQVLAAPATTNFRFIRFDSMFRLIPRGFDQWMIASTCARIVLGFSLLRNPAARWACVPVSLVLAWIESDALGRQQPKVLFAGIFLVLLYYVVRRSSQVAGREWAGLFGFVGVHLLFVYSVRMSSATFVYLSTAQLAAVWALIAQRHMPSTPEVARALRCIIYVAAISFMGWIGFTWSFQRLEWAFLYDWMTTEQSLQWSFALMPIIIARHLLPLWMTLGLMRVAQGGPVIEASDGPTRCPSPEDIRRSNLLRAAVGLIALAVFARTAMAAGLGMRLPGTNIYLEFVQHCAIALVLVVGVCLSSRSSAAPSKS